MTANVNFDIFPGKFTRLVLSGGGSKGLAILGALHYIHENNGLGNIEEYWGTSVGSIITLLLCIGYTPFEIFHKFFMMNYFQGEYALDITTILQNSALCPIELLGSKVRQFVETKLGPGANPTFFELYQSFGKKIHIIGANVDTMREVNFNVDTYPLMHILEAIEISCDLPYLFTRKRFNGETYVDGGFINNYAINEADDNKHYVLGICASGETIATNNDNIGWLYRLLYMPITQLHRERVNKLSDKCTNIDLQINNISIIEMSPSKNKKIEVFSEGYKQCRTILADLEGIYKISKEILRYTEEHTPGDGWDL